MFDVIIVFYTVDCLESRVAKYVLSVCFSAISGSGFVRVADVQLHPGDHTEP